MLLSLRIRNKSIEHNQLLSDFNLSIDDREKVAFIGRNGTGKTTLFKVLAGEEDYDGEIVLKKNARLAFTLQEHFSVQNETAIDYILNAIPDYKRLEKIIASDPEEYANEPYKIQEYCDAIQQFTKLGYYNLKSQIFTQLKAYQISEEDCNRKLSTFSGGEKRYIEMVKVMYSGADLLCLDEPTNHMDYEGKAVFIEWLRSTRKAVFVISHDRDVLQEVDRIVELKDKHSESFKGNYTNYLKRNSESTLIGITQYEDALRRLDVLAKKIEAATARKARDPQAKRLEVQLMKEYDELKESLSKPSFWIDKDSDSLTDKKTLEKYDKFKDKTIQIGQGKTTKVHTQMLARVNNFSLGYGSPLFKPLDFAINGGNRIQIKGRNGYGKTTFLRAFIALNDEQKPNSTIYSGDIAFEKKLKIGVYEQELNAAYTELTVSQAIQAIYTDKKVSLTREQIYRIMSQYLFEPIKYSDAKISTLSGGEKARIQIITMFANNPELLILDEPTNHLDLPSIEELEKVLTSFSGAIMYVSHDSYFNEKIAERVIEIEPVE